MFLTFLKRFLSKVSKFQIQSKTLKTVIATRNEPMMME